MESNITIKATIDEMDKFFDENSVCSVRYYERNGNGTFKARIRHAERKRHLSGTFTIPQIIARLGKTFLDLLRSGEELDCDLIIGDSDMPASFVWDSECKITDYGIERFKPIMVAPYKKLPNGNIEIYCDSYKLGEDFTLAAAGYIGQSEYDKIFGEMPQD